jgi:hypothetical protein
LSEEARLVDLLEDDVLLRAVEGTPGCDMALKGAELALGVAVGMPLTEEREECFGLERAIALKLLFNPGPIELEWIRMGAIGAWSLESTRWLSGAEILTGGRDAHPGPRGGLFESLAIFAFAEHEVYLAVGLHGASFWSAMLRVIRPNG